MNSVQTQAKVLCLQVWVLKMVGHAYRIWWMDIYMIYGYGCVMWNRQSGQLACLWSHVAMQVWWNVWEHGNGVMLTPGENSSKQMEQNDWSAPLLNLSCFNLLISPQLKPLGAGASPLSSSISASAPARKPVSSLSSSVSVGCTSGSSISTKALTPLWSWRVSASRCAYRKICWESWEHREGANPGIRKQIWALKLK